MDGDNRFYAFGWRRVTRAGAQALDGDLFPDGNRTIRQGQA